MLTCQMSDVTPVTVPRCKATCLIDAGVGLILLAPQGVEFEVFGALGDADAAAALMELVGHKTESVYQHYDIVAERNLPEAVRKYVSGLMQTEKLKGQRG